MKSIFKSRVFWLAILQSIVGSVLLFTPDTPPYLGVALLAKSIVDVILRYVTVDEIE